jgi:hypothetical protein
MSTKQEQQKLAEEILAEQKLTERDAREAGLLEGVVRDNILFDLGRPNDLLRLQVKCVWGNNYRANVFVGEDLASARVAHSYFVKADGNGKILTSTPIIARLYWAEKNPQPKAEGMSEPD